MTRLMSEPSTRPIPGIDYSTLSPQQKGVFSAETILRNLERSEAQYVSQMGEVSAVATCHEASDTWPTDIANVRIVRPMDETRAAVRRIWTDAFRAFLRSRQGDSEGDSSRPLLEDPGLAQWQEEESENWKHLYEKIRCYLKLSTGWDGYSAPPPARRAVHRAKNFLSTLGNYNVAPTRLKPSVAGGIGMTFRNGPRKSYVEFYNDGAVCALFSDGNSEPITRQVQASRGAYRDLITEIQEYLNG